jgi:hypothetical protein
MMQTNVSEDTMVVISLFDSSNDFIKKKGFVCHSIEEVVAPWSKLATRIGKQKTLSQRYTLKRVKQ